MQAILIRGGGSYKVTKLKFSLKDFAIIVNTPVLDIDAYRTQFISISKMILENMYQEHTTCHYFQGSA